jgi:AhpD family alkylhydroperoxidase
MAAERVRIDKASPETYKKLIGVSTEVSAAAAAAGLSRAVVELVNLRCSQINACAFCLSLHHEAGIAAGLTEQQIAVLPAWREAPALFDDQQRAPRRRYRLRPRHRRTGHRTDRRPDLGGDRDQRLQPTVDRERLRGA